jgi:hypothetical protein
MSGALPTRSTRRRPTTKIGHVRIVNSAATTGNGN